MSAPSFSAQKRIRDEHGYLLFLRHTFSNKKRCCYNARKTINFNLNKISCVQTATQPIEIAVILIVLTLAASLEPDVYTVFSYG